MITNLSIFVLRTTTLEERVQDTMGYREEEAMLHAGTVLSRSAAPIRSRPWVVPGTACPATREEVVITWLMRGVEAIPRFGEDRCPQPHPARRRPPPTLSPVTIAHAANHHEVRLVQLGFGRLTSSATRPLVARKATRLKKV
jgi:hypothetical protein